MSTQVKITGLNRRGQGTFVEGGDTVVVPYALPGEAVTVARNGTRAELLSVVTPSPDRVEPPCPHFGTCGGCALQHLQPEAYDAFKRQEIADALAGAKLDVRLAPTIKVPPGSRRRATFTAERDSKGDVVLGFRQAMSHRVVPIESCLVVDPELSDRLDLFAQLARRAMAGTSKAIQLSVTTTATGLDVVIRDAPKLTSKVRQALIADAIDLDLARLTFGSELLVETRAPLLQWGSVGIVPPAGGFLQSTRTSEAAMQALVLDHLKGAKRIADLFSGIGTFALPLAEQATVHAVEGDGRALAALDRAYRAADGLKPVTTEKRDLFFRPLTADELNRFKGVVFDPPRAGAPAQARQIARSIVPKVVAVSCNPATLARDLRLLVNGGYRIDTVTPVDQFLYSAHVEVVVTLTKTR